MQLTLKSSAFDNGGTIPSKYTCEGKDISPPLEWDNVPEETVSFVLIADDPDAPDPKNPKMTFVHWVVINIPADVKSIPENPKSIAPGVIEGVNDAQKTGYTGPCPPIGSHRYFFKLYALDKKLEEMESPTKDQVERAMDGHIIEKAEIIGLYKKVK